ncbi:DUF975 family protein [Lachnospiraceae bacterium LCP25S3_G4]
MWSRVDLKERAKLAFRNNYWSAVAVSFIIFIVGVLFSDGARNASNSNHSGLSGRFYNMQQWFYNPRNAFLTLVMSITVLMIAVVCIVFRILVKSAIDVGGKRFFMENREAKPGVGNIFYVFKSGCYWNVVVVMFLRGLFTFLWTLLLVIPGIVKAYEYRMIPYILSENPGMNYQQAFAISKQMMTGQKMDTFILDLSFILWAMLSGITCGIVGIFYVNPYIHATESELYAVLRAHAFHQGGLTTRDLPGFGQYYNY